MFSTDNLAIYRIIQAATFIVDLNLIVTSTCLKMTSEELRRLEEEDT